MRPAEPTVVNYVDMIRTWAISVAENLVNLSLDSEDDNFSIELHECWVTQDLCILMRFKEAGRLRGVYLKDVTVDYLTGFEMTKVDRKYHATFSDSQAQNIFDYGFIFHEPEGVAWTDLAGYQWRDPQPPSDWSAAVDEAVRLVTVFKHR